MAHLLAVRASPPHGLALWLALAGLALLVMVPRQLTRLRISYEAWRVAHALVAIGVLAIAFWHVRALGRSSTTPAEQAAITAFVLGCAALLLFARVVRPALSLRRPWQVTAVRAEGPRVWTLVFEAIDHDGLLFQPGQSVWLTLGRSPFSPRQHPFTIASSAASPRRVELTIKELGDFTREIGRTPVGTRAFLTGPFGAFSLDVREARLLVAIAGGIGITPMMSMLRTLRDLGDRRPVLLLYGCGSPEKIVFAAELDDLARALNLRVVHVVESAPPSFPGERGIMRPELLRNHVTDAFADAEHFVCGPEPMMNLVERALHDLGVHGDRIHTEHFVLVGSRPPGGRSFRERHVRALAAALALGLVMGAAIVAVVRVRIGELSRLDDASRADHTVFRMSPQSGATAGPCRVTPQRCRAPQNGPADGSSCEPVPPRSQAPSVMSSSSLPRDARSARSSSSARSDSSTIPSSRAQFDTTSTAAVGSPGAARSDCVIGTAPDGSTSTSPTVDASSCPPHPATAAARISTAPRMIERDGPQFITNLQLVLEVLGLQTTRHLDNDVRSRVSMNSLERKLPRPVARR